MRQNAWRPALHSWPGRQSAPVPSLVWLLTRLAALEVAGLLQTLHRWSPANPFLVHFARNGNTTARVLRRHAWQGRTAHDGAKAQLQRQIPKMTGWPLCRQWKSSTAACAACVIGVKPWWQSAVAPVDGHAMQTSHASRSACVFQGSCKPEAHRKPCAAINHKNPAGWRVRGRILAIFHSGPLLQHPERSEWRGR